MKKYIAVEVPNEGFDPETYYNETLAEQDLVYIGGNNELREMNSKLKEKYIDGLRKLYEELEEARIDDKEIDLNEAVKNNIEPYISDKVNYIVDLAYEFGTSRGEYKFRSVCELLELIYDEHFYYNEIRGSFQGEWNYIICPESKLNLIPWIEAVYFGCGSEWAVSVDKMEENEDPQNVSYQYVYHYDIEDIREELAKNHKCNKDEILMRKIKDRIVNYNYEYETL